MIEGIKRKKPSNPWICIMVLLIIVVLAVAVWRIVIFNLEKEELDLSEKSLFDIDADDVYYMGIADYSYYNRNGTYDIIDGEAIEYIITNLRGLSVRECDPTFYMKNEERGLALEITLKDRDEKFKEDDIRKSYDIEILGKNENGNYVLCLASYYEEVVEVVEGDLDYEYLKSLYVDEVKKNGGTLEEEVTE